MKELLALCLIGAVVAEPPAPYAPSGWRPSGPAFELPQRGQNPNYLPPVEPRTPAAVPDAEDDVTVQGLPPRQEQLPIFQPSPINGQQYVGPQFNADIQNLDQSLNQAQVQQQKAREFARQKQENEARQPSVNTPRQFNPRTTVNPTQTAFTHRPEFRTTTATAVTDFDLNEGETDEVVPPAVAEKQKVSVEVTKQNIQEYPPELFLNPLAQLRLQPLQLSQSPFLVSGPQSQKQVAGFDAQTHFAALPSVIAQQQLEQQRALLQQYPGNQAAFVISGQTSNKGFLIQSPQPLQPINAQLIPFQGQNVVLQPQGVNQPNSDEPKTEGDDDNDDDEERDNNQSRQPQNPLVPQFGYQPQSQVVYPQPQGFQQPQLQQPQVIYQPQPAYQAQAETVYQQPQGGFQQPQVAYQPQQVAYSQPALQPQLAYQPQVETVYQQPQGVQQPQVAYQPQQVAYPQPALQPQPQVETVYQQPQGFQQPQLAYQPQQVAYPQPALQPQAVFQQPQAFQPQADQPQIYQQQSSYQPQVYQPQLIYNQQPQSPDQQIYPQGQLVTSRNLNQYYQQQQNSPQIQGQGQDALQSGFDVNQQGNSLDQDKDEDANEDGGATATAVATAFGARTQPRVYTRYGAPVPRAQTATTESPVEEVTTEEGPAIAEATAVARGGRRKSAKLRQRRIRPDSPVFQLDKSGRLVLVSEQ